MGMAASQARFLSLTARKSNVEFQGQQVNQQRTTLSNESAAYNSQLLTMKVPTAPSSDTYTKTTYTTKDSANRTYTLNNISSNSDGTYNATMIYSTTGTASADGNGQFTKTASGYTYNKKALTVTSDTASLQKAFGDAYDSSKSYYSFVKSSTTDSSGTTTEVLGYISEKTLSDALGNASVGSSQYLDYKYLQDNQSIKQTATWSNIAPENIKYTSSGRLESITYGGFEYDMTSTTTTDNDAYNDATNEYNYQKEVYNQTLNQINAKLSIIQQQDKNLELKLKDLDTEQSAISTELDAVKKVISKNVESTFKTFNA